MQGMKKDGAEDGRGVDLMASMNAAEHEREEAEKGVESEEE